MHVCKEGIAIAMENPDENHIYFACIKISGSFKSTAQWINVIFYCCIFFAYAHVADKKAEL